MKKFLIPSIILGAVVIIAGGIFMYLQTQHPTTKGTKKLPPLIVSATGDQFSLKANTQDSLGVDPATTFTMTSKESITPKVITANLQIEPTFNYKIESSDNNTFTLVPQEKLKPNTVYTFAVATQQQDTGSKRQYTWAYQIKDTFKITGTLPRDKTTNIPTNSGIELTFSSENYINYQQFIDITPKTEGRFEQFRKTLVFVPKELSRGTVYTVTVKKGLPLKESTETLPADYTFQFETESQNQNAGYLTFASSFYEYPTGEAPVLTLQEYGTGLSKVSVTAWQFSNFAEFSDAVKTKTVSTPYWAYYAQENNPYPTGSLQKRLTFDATITDNSYFSKYFTFPEALPAGYYLVSITRDNKTIQAFLQVGNMTAVFQGSSTKSLLWLHTLNNKKAVSGATISYSADSGFSEKTNSDGLATFDTPTELKNAATSSSNYQLYFFTVTKGDEHILIPAQRDYGFGYYDTGTAVQNSYWSHLYTNRNLYLPTDSLKFWGVVKARSGSSPQTVTAELTSMNYYSPDASSKKVVGSKTVELSDFNTFQGAIDYANLAPGSYRLTVLTGDQEITTTYVQIQTYTKPAYKIDVATPKKAVFAGEKVTFAITTAFFDGTPVAHLNLNYTGSLGTGTITTDDNGQAQVVLNTNYNPDNTGYPQYQYFSVTPASSETTNIYSDAYVYTFGPHYQVSLEAKKEGTISGDVHEISLDKVNADPQNFAWDFTGKPIPGASVALAISEQYYQKTETGSYYDFINKRTNVTYSYEPRENLLKKDTITTDQKGAFQYSFTFDQTKTYKIVAEVTDPTGRVAQNMTYLYLGGQGYYGLGGDNYYLRSAKESQSSQTESYQPGESVQLTFLKNEAELPKDTNSPFIYFRDHSGITDVSTSSEPTYAFKFQEADAPNVYVYGIYFDGRTYHVTSPHSIAYDKNLKKLTIKITPDKNQYEPGDTAKLSINVTNADGQPVVSEVNVSIIDEALAAIQWNDQTNILDNLYRLIQPSITYSYTTDKAVTAPAAERGGCFTGQTKILMADGSKKNISDVKIGDRIVTKQNQNSSTLATAEVVGTTKHLINEYLTINDTLNITPVHIIYLNDRWQEAGLAKTGDYLRSSTGEKVVITSVIRHYRPAEVYNLETSLHTFMAEGIYVHNEKGGNRQNFQDVAYFNSVKTNSDGQATVAFKLPDNITSWRTTVQAVTKDLKASAIQTALIATKPFFVDIANSSEYLTADQPVVKIRGVGKGISDKTAITVTVKYPDLNKSETYHSQGYAAIDVPLPQFTEGSHSMVVKATAGNLADTVTKQIIFNKTNLTTNTVGYYLLESATKIVGSAAGATTVTFLNKERGQYYNVLQNLKWYSGDRLDQRLARTYSQKLLNAYFNEKNEPPTVPFTDYQLPEGGISILPYSSAELLLTAKTLELASNSFDASAAKQYFYNVLNNKNSSAEEITYALFGLANVGEPVLTDINNFMSSQTLPPEMKLYLARGLDNLGAGEYAKTILTDILTSAGQAVDPYIRLNLGKDQDEMTEYTYQAAILASAVSMPEAEKLFNYAVANPAVHQLNTLEQLSYLTKTLPLLSGKPVSFSYTLNNSKKPVSLKDNETYALVLKPEEINTITFSDISGQVGAIAIYEQPLDLAVEKQDSSLTIKRAYSVSGKDTTTFQESDVVKITITPTIGAKAMDTEYQITDYLPAGLKVLTDTYTRNIPYDQKQQYPYEVNGQAVKFWSGKPASAFTYYAIVIGKGTYQADPTTMQGFVVQDSKAYGAAATITIN